MYSIARSLLFSVPPEWAHLAVLKTLSLYGQTPISNTSETTITVGRLKCANRVGVAAGFDKDGIAIRGLAKLGFGFLELGAVTPRPQAGNVRPRVFRLKQDSAIINRLGFNNDGVDSLAQRLSSSNNNVKIPVGVNIGKNWDTPISHAAADYLQCFNTVKYVADFVTVNVSSPNTPHLRDLMSTKHATPLLSQIVAARDSHAQQTGSYVSVFVKISPDMGGEQIQGSSVAIEEAGCDGIIATNTTIARTEVNGRFASEQGGLSGKPLFARALQAVRNVRDTVGKNFTVIGCGGIWDANSASQMVDAGADLVQVYTALIFRGPGCVRELVEATKGQG